MKHFKYYPDIMLTVVFSKLVAIRYNKESRVLTLNGESIDISYSINQKHESKVLELLHDFESYLATKNSN